MKFPRHERHRKHVATIYGRTKAYRLYRVAHYAAGRRIIKSFATYGEALKHAKATVRDLAKGNEAAALTAGQARDALAALNRLTDFHRQTGRTVSLLGAVSEFTEAAAKLHGRTLGEAVAGYLNTVANVRRKDVSEAVEEFIRGDEPRTKAGEGQRAQLSGKYAYNRAIMLRRFAATFQNTAVSDLSKEHLDKFFETLADFSPKSRNHHRAAVRQFLQWCVRKDCLSPTHRLGEADTMRPERANTAEVLFYTPKEFRALLEAAEGPMQALLAVGGLAGLRTQELLRLDWSDLWRVSGNIEVTARASKTRARRLVEIVPALSTWLEPFRTFTKGRIWTAHEISFQRDLRALCEKAEVTRKPNGLRHAFCSYHLAAHANENATALQAGHAPAMVHTAYKGLATKAEALKWFSVAPVAEPNVIPMKSAEAL
jgi:integrase